MDFNGMDFLTVIIIAFAIVMILAGIFTAYFGSGKGRTIGLLILIVGIIVGAVWIWVCTNPDFKGLYNPNFWDVIWRALVDLIGVVVGALVAVGIFLVGVMKS